MAFAARGRVWAHSHWACMYLLLIIFVLESPSIVPMSKRSPPVCFSEPLPIVFGFNFRAPATKHFHIVAAKSVVHGNLPAVAVNLCLV